MVKYAVLSLHDYFLTMIIRSIYTVDKEGKMSNLQEDLELRSLNMAV